MITISPKAHEWIYDCITKRNKEIPTASIKISVRTTGCGGFAYTTEFQDVNVVADSDISDYGYLVSDQFGRMVLVTTPDADKEIIDGSFIDIITEGLNTRLSIVSPKETNVCGCGKSFTI